MKGNDLARWHGYGKMINLAGTPIYKKRNDHQKFSPQFGGPMDLVSNGLEILAKNRIFELTLIDLATMTLPRTFIEWHKRGPDMARETAIREFTGGFTYTLLAGWLSLPVVWLFNRLTLPHLINRGNSPLNKKGINQKAWINVKTLEEYSHTFDRALKDAVQENRTPSELRHDFICRILGRLEANDSYSPSHTFKKLGLNPNNKYYQAVLSARIPQEEISRLADLFNLSPYTFKGTYKLHEEVADYLKDLKLKVRSSKELKREENQKRIELTERMVKDQKHFINQLVSEFNRVGLSGQIHILDEHHRPMKALSDVGLKDKLIELKYFLEQYVDRVLSDKSTGKLRTDILDKGFQSQISQAFFHQGRKGFLKNILFSDKDGLIKFTTKAKSWLSGIPLLATLIFGVSVAFFNNWFTQRKHHGEIFFPGEGPLHDKSVWPEAISRVPISGFLPALAMNNQAATYLLPTKGSLPAWRLTKIPPPPSVVPMARVGQTMEQTPFSTSTGQRKVRS